MDSESTFDERGIGRYDDPDLMADVAMRAHRRGDREIATMAILLPGVLAKVVEREELELFPEGGSAMHEPTSPTLDDRGDETHPAWGLIGASRVSHSPPGAVLFDSDIRHQHSVIVRVSTARRKRHLKRDWIGREQEFVEVEMSEAQWASFVSSMNTGDGVPCTIRRREQEYDLPGLHYEPRLQESMAETRTAADEAFTEVKEAFEAYEEKKNAQNLRNLKYAIENAPANIEFAGRSLTEHAENVVQKARADIEAMIITQAKQLGIEPGDLGEMPALESPEKED